MGEHTKEPWEWEQHMRGDGQPEQGWEIRGDSENEVEGFVADLYAKEDARRIVACVNACKGIATETLEGLHGVVDVHESALAFAEERARADASEAALKEAVGLLRRAVGMWGPDPFETADDDFSTEVRAFLDGLDTPEDTP